MIPLVGSSRARDYVSISVLLLTMGECTSGMVRFSLISGGMDKLSHSVRVPEPGHFGRSQCDGLAPGYGSTFFSSKDGIL